MSRNEDVTTGIWIDLMDLSANAKLLYLWSFTNGHNNMAGLYKIHLDIIRLELKLSKRDLDQALDELSAGRFAFYEDGVLFVRTRIKKLRQKTTQIARSIERSVRMIPPAHPLRVRFLETYGDEPWLREALSEAKTETVNRPSREGHESSHETGDYVTLTRGSLDPPRSGSGLKERTTTDVEVRPNLRERVDELFAYWQQRCGHTHAMLTPERRRAVEGRLKQGYTDEQVRAGIDGAAVAAFVDANGKRHDDLELICRNGSKLESFIERAKTAKGRVESTAEYLARRGAA